MLLTDTEENLSDQTEFVGSARGYSLNQLEAIITLEHIKTEQNW